MTASLSVVLLYFLSIPKSAYCFPRRQSQYGHKRMDKRRGGNMNVTNPVYMKRDIDDDDDDEEEDDELNPFRESGEGGHDGRVILPRNSVS